MDRLSRVLGRRRAPLFILTGAVLLSLPSLGAGFLWDDYIHALILRGSHELPSLVRSPLDLFRFATPDVNAALLSDGIIPWWADPELRFAFMRPLSAVTHWVDHALWPDSAALMHAHSLLWFVALLGAAGALYREVLGPGWVAVLAFAFYCFDPARGHTLSWIANRNALIAGAASFTAVLLHIRGSRGSNAARWAAPAVFAAALLAGEGAVAGGAYLFAYALVLDERPLRARFVALAPYAGVLALWLALHRSLGYGVAGSGEYFDPLGDPRSFLTAFPARAVVLLFAQLGSVPSNGWNGYDLIHPALPGLILVIATLALLGAAWLAAPAIRRRPTVRFWLTGALLALVPAAAAFPGDRLLTWVSLGAMGFLAEVCDERLTEKPGGLARWAAAVLLAIHLVVNPLLLPPSSAGAAEAQKIVDRAERTTPRGSEIRERTIVYLNPPSDPMVGFIPPARAARGEPRARAQRWLAVGTSALAVERLDERRLAVTPDDGYVVAQTERMLRGPKCKASPGDRVQLPGMGVRITRVTPDGRPASAEFTFDHPLESPEYLWLIWRGEGFVPFTPPAVGAALRVPRLDLLDSLLGPNHPLVKLLRRGGARSRGG